MAAETSQKAAQQGAAPDRLQLHSFPAVELSVLSLARGLSIKQYSKESSQKDKREGQNSMNGLKIYSTAPNGNEAADLENALYFNLAINQIKAESDRMKTTDDPIQIMLTHIDILIHLSRKFVEGARLSIKTSDVKEWNTTFWAWYERSEKRIPTKFRCGIKESAEDLFAQLELVECTQCQAI